MKRLSVYSLILALVIALPLYLLQIGISNHPFKSESINYLFWLSLFYFLLNLLLLSSGKGIRHWGILRLMTTLCIYGFFLIYNLTQFYSLATWNHFYNWDYINYLIITGKAGALLIKIIGLLQNPVAIFGVILLAAVISVLFFLNRQYVTQKTDTLAESTNLKNLWKERQPLFFFILMIVFLIISITTPLKVISTIGPEGILFQEVWLKVRSSNASIARNPGNLNRNIVQKDTAALTNSKPNIIILISDSLRAKNLKVYGYGRDTTPFISKHLDQWVVLRNVFSQSNETDYSLPSLMSGKYPYQGLVRKDWKFYIPFADLDYKLGFISSHHLFRKEIIRYLRKDVQFDLWSTAAPPHKAKNINRHRLRTIFEPGILKKARKNQQVDDFVTLTKISKWIKRVRDDSFLLIAHLHGTHAPYQTSGKGFEKFAPHYLPGEDFFRLTEEELVNSYDTAIRKLDFLMEKLFTKLTTQDILKNSIIFLISDHGEGLGDHGYKFHCTSLYNSEIQVPFLVYFGKNLQPLKQKMESVLQATNSKPKGLIDVAPTLLDIVGIKKPKTLDGVSLFSSDSKDFEFSWQYRYNRRMAVIHKDYKFILTQNSARLECYHMRDDPDEQNPLAGCKEMIPKKLQRYFDSYL